MKYPSLLRRYLATVLDVLVLWCIVFTISRTPVLTERGALACWVMVPSLLLYEPLPRTDLRPAC